MIKLNLTKFHGQENKQSMSFKWYSNEAKGQTNIEEMIKNNLFQQKTTW